MPIKFPIKVPKRYKHATGQTNKHAYEQIILVSNSSGISDM